MTISIDYATLVISVEQSDLTALGGGLYELDANAFRNTLKNLEDSEDGIAFPPTLRHATEATLSGVTYVRQLEVINGYTITFETVGSPYTVTVVGANHNLGDVTNFDGGMSMIVGNSAGLQVVSVGSGLSTPQDERLARIEKFLRNKRVTDPATGQQTVFDDDGSSVLGQGALWENAAGTQAYRGQGAERSERLA
jgi:hypothetical protein